MATDIQKQAKSQAMRSHTTELLRHPPVNLPLNLTDWFSEATIASWAAEELAQLPEQEVAASPQPVAKTEERWRRVAVLMVFAYAMQIFRSREISSACHINPVFRAICGEKPPFVQELEHFRRANRPLIEAVLARLLFRAATTKLGIQPANAAEELQQEVRARAEEQLDTARHLNTWDECDT